uniref:Exosome complex component RRP40 n=1 Tax=Megaselia scalaris TaxID=36166 RepID=T1H7D2_MEGSC
LNEVVVASKAGILKQKKNTFWVDNYQKRYTPVRGETVLGVVSAKSGDIFRVDIGTHEAANLSYLGFEGATKKNRPDVNIGDIVFAKLVVANKDLEPELVCVDSMGKKGKLGVLSDGLMFSCSINLVRKIAKESCPLIPSMQDELPFEIAIGMNGRIWIKAKTIKETVALGTAILASEKASDEDTKKIC